MRALAASAETGFLRIADLSGYTAHQAAEPHSSDAGANGKSGAATESAYYAVIAVDPFQALHPDARCFVVGSDLAGGSGPVGSPASY